MTLFISILLILGMDLSPWYIVPAVALWFMKQLWFVLLSKKAMMRADREICDEYLAKLLETQQTQADAVVEIVEEALKNIRGVDPKLN